MNLDIAIGRLVLNGFTLTVRERARLEAALRSELVALLVGPEAQLSGASALPGLVAPALSVADLATPERLGVGLARSVHASLAGAGLAAPAPEGGR